MKPLVVTLIFTLFFQTGCSLDLKTFGAKSTGGGPISLKGNFPLGEPTFTGFEKYSMSRTAAGEIIFLDNTGEIHIVSAEGEQLRKFTPTGFDQIREIAVDPSGNIYVAGYETSNGDSIIVTYSILGTNRQEIIRLPAFDTGGGVFGSVQLAFLKILDDGSIAVRTWDSAVQIQKFSSAGSPLTSITIVNGASDGQVSNIQDYIANADGSYYVIDYDTNRIQKLKADGSFDSKITWTRHEASSNIRAFMRNTNDGSFLVFENGTDTVLHKIDSNGAPLWNKDGSETGTVFDPLHTGSLMKVGANYYFSIADALYVYSENGSLVDFYKRVMTSPSAVVKAADGNFYAGVETGIIKYSATGQQQNSFGTAMPFRSMTISPNNVIYTTNLLSGGTVFKYDLSGNSLGSFASTATAGSGLCVDANDNLYISDASAIKKIAPDETTVTTFKSGMYTGLHCNADGTLFAVFFDSGTMTSTVQKLDGSGNVLFSFDHSGGGAFVLSYGFSANGSNAVVTDYMGNKIHVFNADTGVYVRSFGNTGIQALSSPAGVAIDKFNEIFVADRVNNFVKKYSLTGTMLLE